MDILRGAKYVAGEVPATLKAFIDKGEEMQPTSVGLKEFLASANLPWLFWSEEKQKFIMVIDNHLASMYRACPQHFMYYALRGIGKKSAVKENEVDRVWFLDFGIVLHRMIELYYRDFRKPGFDPQEWASVRAAEEWTKMNMNVHAQHKEFQSIGGMYGFVGLLFQFATVFTSENEKLRIISQEVSFGKAGEVPIYIGPYLEIYLSGRLDLVIDDGYFICPMDHKSMAYFKNDPAIIYFTDDGPTGYVYALSKILPSIVPEDHILKRDCSKILMNLISKKPTTNPIERFKRIPLRKSTYDLETYKTRMTKTALHLFQDVEDLVLGGVQPYRNTKMCQNWMHYPCTYFDLCRQNSKEGEEATIKNGFVQIKLWDTEAVEPIT